MALVSLFVVIVICPCPGRAVDTGKCPVVECSSEGLYAGVTQRYLSPLSAFLTTGTQPESFCDFLCGLEAVMTVFAVRPRVATSSGARRSPTPGKLLTESDSGSISRISWISCS